MAHSGGGGGGGDPMAVGVEPVHLGDPVGGQHVRLAAALLVAAGLAGLVASALT